MAGKNKKWIDYLNGLVPVFLRKKKVPPFLAGTWLKGLFAICSAGFFYAQRLLG